ncbi:MULTISPECIES: pyrimidine 5'-nucleotidase [Pseudoalteromonas]|uniref:Pyrimidine 5'-nucleotidase n=1 Tax=Pseudoalteromonas haloplanktis TaxID=228 RepID=A0ABU1BG10_PSEHA|nr:MULTISPECIES: pyrimidine 5'-nucleotidase [Pseudoalteromonas]MCF6144223.1 putative hydrolase of the HAD superfamily [Pseudoalteromonas mariniglutinosa NCIMB 1770]MDQ9092686.1 pyrimidine 5'-nucleotidase [Pseudoalteromonas haloplanktis]TMN70561.1 noncanonical pyrimidine nucleotidase, YjjG family [Pseudoalteromonas sp. S1727]BDF96441.1 dUMP phosphatase [Pseudoalteromonas sp. KAN5]
MKYTHVLFDADETLFSFNAFAGLKRMFANYGVNFTEADYQHYQVTNKSLWLAYQDNQITATHLQVTRFSEWAAKLNVPAQTLNDDFLTAMAEICHPLPGAVELLTALKPHARLGIITNGFTQLQARRLARTGLNDMFDWLVISEQVGIAKPAKEIFQHTFDLMGNPDKAQILMVGDTANSDILGAQNAGIDSCWLQHPGFELPQGITPTYKITELVQLQQLLGL